MAIRNIRTIGDEILTMNARPVKEMTPRIKTLIEDMLDTMYDAQGVGLAAPQVGVLKQIVVIDVTEDGSQPIVLINPQIVKLSGKQTGQEGCLSVPGKAGIVTRANYAKVRALNADMVEIEVEGKAGIVTRANYAKVRALNADMVEIEVEGEELLARALQHEIDHLSGVLYVSKVEGELMNASAGEE